MAINPQTLYGLYEKGILDYVPVDLMAGTPIAPMTQMSNPYLNMAKQGSLYQQYGNGDSFSFSGNNNQYSYMNNSQIGSQSSVAQNAYGLQGIGYASNAGANAYGQYGIGVQSNLGGANSWGGITDLKNNVSNSVNKVSAAISNTPAIIKGFISALVIGATGYLLLRKGKKSASEKKGLLSKLNPKNWNIFKSKKTKEETAKAAEQKAEETAKPGFFKRIKNKFSKNKSK